MKTYQFIILSVLLAAIAVIGAIPKQAVEPKLGGIVQATVYTATNSSVNCSAATSTLVLGGSGLTSFIATDDGANNIYLCRAASGCTVGTGMRLNANGGQFSQGDTYQGSYSCIASTATSSLSYSVSY